MQQRMLELSLNIREYCGIDFSNNLKSLELKLSRRLLELGITIDQYLSYLQNNWSEWDKLIEQITINETYFFREFNQLEEFQQLLKQKPDQTINVWCIPCSTGEEAYSLAILAKELEPLTGQRVKIRASDLNKKVLDKARKGFFSKNSLSFRRLPESREYLKNYFIETDLGFEVKDEIKQMVSFEPFNLTDYYKYALYSQMDFIFCRNVLIYFDDDTIKNIIRSFYTNLKNDGYLFLGHAESISNIESKFVPVYTKETFYYRKVENPLFVTSLF